MEFLSLLSHVILVAITALPFVLIGGALVDFFLTRDSKRHIR